MNRASFISLCASMHKGNELVRFVPEADIKNSPMVMIDKSLYFGNGSLKICILKIMNIKVTHKDYG